MTQRLNISIVLFNPDWDEVATLVTELLHVQSLHLLYLVDNSPVNNFECVNSETGEITNALSVNSDKIRYIFAGKNLGYGSAHNLAIRESIYDSLPYHLVVNSDIVLHAADMDQLCDFMDEQPSVGSLMPRVTYPNGDIQYLCKLLPTPLDVFGRRFLPSSWISKRNARYELRTSGYDRPMNVPYLSGCFMFLRTKAVYEARLFDERYFMYPEDLDLTRTIHRNYLTLYYPAVTIVHNHAKGSYHSFHLLWVHVVNMCRYFNKWGWFFDAERKRVNRQTLVDLGLD